MRQKPRHYLVIAQDMFKTYDFLRDLFSDEITPDSVKCFCRELGRLILLRRELAVALGDLQMAQDITAKIYLCSSINPAYRMLIHSLRATSKQRP